MTQPPRNSVLIFNWIFIPGLFLLLLNDHYLKWEFSNQITGKISDLIGLLIFPMFLQFLFPRLSRISVLLAGALFVFWKLPVSTPFITSYNRFAIIPITRTVDYSDLIALSVLPLADYFIKRIDQYKIAGKTSTFLTWLAMIPVTLGFMATSPPVSFYMQPGGDIHIGKAYRLKISREEALARLRAEGFAVQPDTSQHETGRATYFLMKNVVLDGGKDTIKAIQFGFLGEGKKTLLLINNVQLRNSESAENWRMLKRYYRRLIHSGVVEELK
ncbi:MAG TPA: hypothetical protein VGN00_22105 [Puia sp.]|jgi:hypothetical protein